MQIKSHNTKNGPEIDTSIETYNVKKLTLTALLFVFFVIILRRAWVSDDAYITFRTVDNFINGYGLTWNIDERVQAFTHPLWMFLISLFYFFTREIYFTVIFISLFLSSLSVILIPMKLSKSGFGSTLAILVLMFSNAFVDYSTSGLENPLSYLISGLFLFVYFNKKGEKYTCQELFLLSLIASLAAFNRLDSFIIFLPPLLYAFLKNDHKKQALKAIVLGQFPIILWEIFSIIYYGFPFPNTYYAKLNHMIPGDQLLIQGGYYWLQSLTSDPVTVSTIILFCVLFITSKSTKKDFQSIAVITGVILYVAGITKSGGDFMAGRFFAVPIYIFAVLISRIKLKNSSTVFSACLLAFPIILGMIATPTTFDVTPGTDDLIDKRGIANERMYYFPTNALINQSRESTNPFHSWIRDGYYYKNLAEFEEQKLVATEAVIGMKGFFAGPNVHIIDQYGLGDPLLARLPAIFNNNWRIGHFQRYIPDGYVDSVITGENLIEDSALKGYYTYLTLITQGDLFDSHRLKAIAKMNLGLLNSRINIEYYQFANAKNIKLEQLPQVQDGIECNNADTLRYPFNSGLGINLEQKFFNKEIILGLDSNASYLVWFYRKGELAHKSVTYPSNLKGIRATVVKIPDNIASQGYDFIRVIPGTRAEAYCIGYLKFDN